MARVAGAQHTAAVRVSEGLGGRGAALPESEELLGGEPDVAGDLAEEAGGDVAGVEGDGGASAVGVAVLAVRTALPGEGEPEAEEAGLDLAGLEDGDMPHVRRPGAARCR